MAPSPASPLNISCAGKNTSKDCSTTIHQQVHRAQTLDQPQFPFSDDKPTFIELEAVIKLVRNGKAPGVDSVTVKVIKVEGETLKNRLLTLLWLVWHSDRISTAWKKAIIAPILRKGDSSECKNYRGTSVLFIVGKLFMEIIQLRLQKLHEQTSREESESESGIRPGQGCCDQIFVIWQLMEEYVRCGRMVIVFIDFGSSSCVSNRDQLFKEFPILTRCVREMWPHQHYWACDQHYHEQSIYGQFWHAVWRLWEQLDVCRCLQHILDVSLCNRILNEIMLRPSTNGWRNHPDKKATMVRTRLPHEYHQDALQTLWCRWAHDWKVLQPASKKTWSKPMKEDLCNRTV